MSKRSGWFTPSATGWGILLLFAAMSGACRSGAEDRAEVKSVASAIDRLRDAPNPEKAQRLSELSKVPCSLPDVCELRDRCVGAYRLHVAALDEIASFKVAPDADRVVATEKKLEGARKLTLECLENELVVGRRHGTQK